MVNNILKGVSLLGHAGWDKKVGWTGRAAKEEKGEEWTGRKNQPRRRKDRNGLGGKISQGGEKRGVDGRGEGAAKEEKGEE